MSNSNPALQQLDLRQLTQLEYILLGDLRDVLEEETSEQNRKWLVAIVEVLLETLPREFQLRHADGYFQELVMKCPRVDAEIGQLEDEQATLYEQLRDLRERLENSKSFSLQAQRLKQELAIWSQQLCKYNLAEERLVQDIYCRDIGGGD